RRHQVKAACTHCRQACKRCDALRPCGRCVALDIADSCVDAPPRRPRQVGVKRGPYRKQQ
ncbi:hypothetical protein DFJ73DRAFT_600218, partial [Zopfochytrium polystomum]